MIMKHAGHLTSLEYSQRTINWKKEPQRTISTQQLCRIHTKSLKKFTIHARFCMSSHTLLLPQSTSRVTMPYTLTMHSVRHRSLSMFASKSQFGIAELNENGLKQKKMKNWFCLDVEHIPHDTRDYVPLVRDCLGVKNQVSSFSSHQ